MPAASRRSLLRGSTAAVAFALLLGACGGGATEPAADPAGLFDRVLSAEDCLAAGTCSPAPEVSGGAASPRPAAPGSYAGLAAGFTADGYPYLGDPDAPVSLVEFSDYLCPFCRRHFDQTAPALLERYGASGEVKFVFRDFPLAGLHPTAPGAHAASLCVSEQGAHLFWAMHDELFRTQSEWSGLADNASFLATVAEGVGADMDAYQSCVDSGRAVPVIEQRVTEGFQLGFSGTPSFHVVDHRSDQTYEVVGAQPLEAFVALLDAVVAGEGPPVAEEPPADAPQLPRWADAAGLAPDPARPGYNLAGDAYRGDPGAPLVVIEISDFQCPFCRRHTLETQPTLDEQFVDTGRVMWVYKHLPLRNHPQAAAAAAAAECAGDQGAFWEMHDRLFDTVEEWSVDPPDPVLVDLAGELGLDADAFAACVSGRAALERVLDDLSDLEGVIGSTPTFVIVAEGDVSVIEGAQPADQFFATFQEMLGQS